MADFDEYEYLERNYDAPPRDLKAYSDDRGRRGRPRDERSDRFQEREQRRPRRDDYGAMGDPRDRDRDWQGPPRGGGPMRRRSRSRDRQDRARRPGPPGPPGVPETREKTPPDVRAAKERERELREMERDTRTVFAYNLNLKADERDIYEFFSTAGKVTDVKVITDRNTKKSKGFAYIEYAKQEDTLNALALTGQTLLGQAVMVKSSEAEKNLAWEAQQAAQNQAAAAALANAGSCRLHVTNLHTHLSDTDLKPLFEPFGAIDQIQLVKDAVGRSQGQAYVQFKNGQEAQRAMQHWNGRAVAGMVLAVAVAPVIDNPYAPIVGELDEDEENGGGFKLTSNARAALMSRLASSAGIQIASSGAAGGGAFAGSANAGFLGQGGPVIKDTALLLEQGIFGPASPIPTQCLLLKNMFNPQEETDPNWAEDIQNDVGEECGKYGPVTHIYVDKNSKGFVYLKFGSVEASQKASQALHGRWFAGRQVVAEFQFVQPYNTYFKC